MLAPVHQDRSAETRDDWVRPADPGSNPGDPTIQCDRMSIRVANVDDAATVARLVQQGLGRYYAPARVTTERVMSNLADVKNIFLLALDGKRTVGTIRIELTDIDLAELRWLAVDKRFRQKGVGRALALAALQLLRRKRMRKVVVRTTTDNWAAIELWLKLGFVSEGYFREHYRRGMDIIQLAKFLKR